MLVGSLPRTRRAAHRRTATSRRSIGQHHARIEQAARIQRRLDRPHHRQRRRRLARGQLGALEPADAVLGREGAAEAIDDVVDAGVGRESRVRRGSRPPRRPRAPAGCSAGCRRPGGRSDVARAGHDGLERGVGGATKSASADSGTPMSCLMLSPSTPCASGIASRSCHSVRACSSLAVTTTSTASPASVAATSAASARSRSTVSSCGEARSTSTDHSGAPARLPAAAARAARRSGAAPAPATARSWPRSRPARRRTPRAGAASAPPRRPACGRSPTR